MGQNRNRNRLHLEITVELESALTTLARSEGYPSLQPFLREALRRVAEAGMPPAQRGGGEDSEVVMRAVTLLADELRVELKGQFREMQEQHRSTAAAMTAISAAGHLACLEGLSALKAGNEDIYASVTPGEHKWGLDQLARSRAAIESINMPSARLTAKVKMALNALPGVDRILSG